MQDNFDQFQYNTNSDGVYRGYGYTEKPKKQKRGMPAVAIIAICAVISLMTGVIGGVAGNIIAGDNVGTTGGGTTVIYESVTLKDSEGKDITETMTVGEVASLAKDSVVEITTEAVPTGSFMMQYVSEGAGSGVIMTKDGYIATNYHVIDGATKVSVRTTDGTSYEAKIVGGDEKTDLAVLKI